MWLGKKSITVLKTFIDGYVTCEGFNEISAALVPPFHLFLPWVQMIYNHDGSYYNWDGIILQNSDNDEAKAFEKFLELFDEFRKLKLNVISAAINDADSINFSFTKSYQETWSIKRDKNPASDELFIVEYDKKLGYTIYHRLDNKGTVWDSTLLSHLQKNMLLMFRENQWIGITPKELI